MELTTLTQDNLLSIVNSQKTDFKHVLVYIYPKDDTPGCTAESLEFSDLYEEFIKLNVEVVGLSKDPMSSHEKFSSKYQLKQALISDPDCHLIKGLGGYGEKNTYGKVTTGVIRSTFLVDLQQGVSLKAWKNVSAKGHAAKVLDFIRNELPK